MSTGAFFRVPLTETKDGKVTHIGFAYHYGTKRSNTDTGIREQRVPTGNGYTLPAIKRGERIYRDLQQALNDWKAEHDGEGSSVQRGSAQTPRRPHPQPHR